MNNSENTIASLEQQLNKIYRKKLRTDSLSFAALMLFALLTSFFCFFILDYMTDFPMPVRLLLSLAAIGTFCFFLPVKRRRTVLRHKTPAQISCEVESKASSLLPGGFHSILISAIEFASNPSIGGSHDLKSNVIKNSSLPEYNPSRIKLHDHARLRLLLRFGPAVIAIYAAWSLLGSHSLATFFKRAVGLNAYYLTNTRITNIDAPRFLARFDDADFRIDIEGRRPASGRLRVRLDNGESFYLNLSQDPDSSSYSASLKQAETSFEFQIELGDAYKIIRHVEVIPEPTIHSSEIIVKYPQYAMLPDLAEKFGPLEVLEGSSISFNITPDRDINSCFFVLNGNEMPMQKNQNSFSMTTEPLSQGGLFSIKLVDNRGISNNKRLDFPLIVKQDSPCVVQLARPTEGSFFAPVSQMRWDVSIGDDYGLQELVLRYTLYRRKEDNTLEKVRDGVIPLRKFAGEREAKIEGVLDLRTLKLEPGRVLGLEFIAKDRKTDRKTEEHGNSGAIRVNIVTPAELKQIIESEMIGMRNVINDIQTDLKFQSKRIEIYKKHGGKEK